MVKTSVNLIINVITLTTVCVISTSISYENLFLCTQTLMSENIVAN